MKIHEFQAKQFLRNAGVSVPRGIVATSADEAAAAYRELNGAVAVVKAQIHAGGRGKGTVKTNPQQHGVQLVRSAEEAARAAGNLLGQPLVTLQTGPEGQIVRRVLVEEGCDIARELYLGIVVDRAAAGPVLIMSSEGGMNIEEVAAKTPELIYKEPFSPDSGLQSFQVRKLAAKLNLSAATARSADKFLKQLCRAFVAKDCSLVEINPLVITGAGRVAGARRQDDVSTTTRCSATRTSPSCAICRKRSRPRCKPDMAGLSYVKLRRQHRLAW